MNAKSELKKEISMNNLLDMFSTMKWIGKREGIAGRAVRKNRLLPVLLVMIMCLSLAGCGRKNVAVQDTPGAAVSSAIEDGSGQTVPEAAATASTFEFELESTDTETAADETVNSGTGPGTSSDASEATGAELNGGADAEGTSAEPLLDEAGSYTTKDDVALYIHTYGRLPSNFITKKQAKKLGWTGGSLEEFAPGKCIGGDYFGNYEGLLPEEKDYRECDIDTLGKKKRGAKRIIYTDDGYIYYTGDHYESFELLYEP